MEDVVNPYQQLPADKPELPAMTQESELSDAQLERQDYVEGVIFEALEQLAEKKLEFDVEMIGNVRDAIEKEFACRAIMTEMEFYPYF
jgi:hypothetical protein